MSQFPPPYPPRPPTIGWQAGPGQHQWQQHQNWGHFAPQFQPPRRRGNGGLIAAVLVLVAAMGFGAYALSRPHAPSVASTPQVRVTSVRSTPTPPPTTPPPTSPPPTTPPPTTPTDPPSTTPVPTGTAVLPQRTWEALPGPHSTHEYWVTLQQNKLYAQDVPTTTCPDLPGSFDSFQNYQVWAAAAVNCQHNGWAPAFKAAGLTLRKPKVHFFDAPIQTPCGNSGERSFFCGTWDNANLGIYLQAEEATPRQRMSPFFTIAHEYAHHAQHQAGILLASSQLAQINLDNMERSRRVELQASCWTSRIMVTTVSVAFDEDDYAWYVNWSQQDLRPTHGSPESNQYWWQRGFYMTSLAGCNVWTAGANRVT